MGQQHIPNGVQFLTIPQVAEELNLSERTVWRRIDDEEIKVNHFGSSTRVKRGDLDDYIWRCSGKPGDAAPDDNTDPDE